MEWALDLLLSVDSLFANIVMYCDCTFYYYWSCYHTVLNELAIYILDNGALHVVSESKCFWIGSDDLN